MKANAFALYCSSYILSDRMLISRPRCHSHVWIQYESLLFMSKNERCMKATHYIHFEPVPMRISERIRTNAHSVSDAERVLRGVIIFVEIKKKEPTTWALLGTPAFTRASPLKTVKWKPHFVDLDGTKVEMVFGHQHDQQRLSEFHTRFRALGPTHTHTRTHIRV